MLSKASDLFKEDPYDKFLAINRLFDVGLSAEELNRICKGEIVDIPEVVTFAPRKD